MPQSFLPFTAFIPDGGDFGPQLALAQNVLPVHNSFRPLNEKAILSTENDGPVTGAHVHVYQQSRAIQFLRPDSDNSVGTWQAWDGSATLYVALNEENADDAKFIFAGGGPVLQAVKLGLSNPLATTATSHFLRWRYRIPVLTTSAWTAKAELMQNTTVIATDTATGSAVTGWVTRDYALTAPEMAAITDYAALFIRFTASAPGAAQTLVPTADAGIGAWVTNAFSSSNLFQSIDETSFSDADYIQSGILAPGGTVDTYKATLAVGVDPQGRGGHILHYRYRGLNAGVTVKIRLKNGATLVKEMVHAGAATTFQAVNQTLTAAEAALLAPGYAGTLEAEASFPADVTSTVSQQLDPSSTDSSVNFFVVGAATIHEALADASDSSYIEMPGPPEGLGTCQVSLDVGTDPKSGLSHTLLCRAFIPTGTTARMTLLEGTTPRAFVDCPGVSGFTDYTYTLSAAEANAIVDYSLLHLKIEALAYGQFFSRAHLLIPEVRRGLVSFANLEVPAAQRVEISWTETEVPDGTTSYKGDVPTTFAGTKQRIWSVTTAKWEDLSKVGAYAGGGAKPGSWHFCSFGNDIVATNYIDPVQYRPANTGLFADLITSTLKPKARFCCPFRDQLMLGGINLTGHFDDEIWISGVDNARDFQPSLQTQSDYQRIVSCPGQIMGLVGGDFALVFKRRSIHRIDWTGGPTIFRVSDVTNSIGTPYPRSIVAADGAIYFWGGNAFYRTDGYSIPEKVGSEVLARFLVDTDFSAAAIAQVDPQEIAIEDQLLTGHYAHHAGVIIWTYQGKTDTSYRHTRAVVYNPGLDQWSAWLLPSGGDVSLLIQRPNTTGSNTWLLRDTVGFEWNGSRSAYFRYSGSETYEGTLTSSRQALGYDDQERPTTTLLKGILPIFSFQGDVAPPNLSITASVSLDPRFVTNVRSETYDASSANEALVYPHRLSGTWFSFRVVIPPMFREMLVAFRGLWLDWDKDGRSGG